MGVNGKCVDSSLLAARLFNNSGVCVSVSIRFASRSVVLSTSPAHAKLPFAGDYSLAICVCVFESIKTKNYHPVRTRTLFETILDIWSTKAGSKSVMWTIFWRESMIDSRWSALWQKVDCSTVVLSTDSLARWYLTGGDY